MSKKRYSYSKLTTFRQCEFQYLSSYELRQESDENIYGLAGTTVHNIIEDIQEKKITNEEGLMRFDEEMEMHEILGYTFTSEKTKNNFIESIRHFIKYFKPIDKGKVEVEKDFVADFDGHEVIGFIDILIHNEDGTVSIVDLKTSSKYSKKAIEEHCNQLLIYAIAMEQQGFTVKDVSWNMMKYSMIPTKRGKKMVLRNELTDEKFEEAYVYYPLSDESKNRCKEWVIETIEMIEAKDVFDTWETNCDEPFFCTNLCSFCGKCSKGKELRDNYFRNR